MSAYIGKRKGMRVCTDVTPPVFPSRVCRFFGHFWDVSRGWSYQGNPEWKKCDRCGAEESWHDYGTCEADAALAEADA